MTRLPLEPTPRPSADGGFDGGGDGSVVVTGGLSKLGRVVLHWLAAQGCKRFLLLNRRAPTVREQRDLDRLQGLGARVSCLEGVDCGDALRVERAIGTARGSHPYFTGVLHVAGEVRDGRVGQTPWSEVERSLAPKWIGALALA